VKSCSLIHPSLCKVRTKKPKQWNSFLNYSIIWLFRQCNCDHQSHVTTHVCKWILWWKTSQRKGDQPGMGRHTYNPSSLEVEAGGSRVWRQPGLHSKFIPAWSLQQYHTSKHKEKKTNKQEHPNCSGVRDEEDPGLRPVKQKVSETPSQSISWAWWWKFVIPTSWEF
jgi:hypothetical protein